MRASFRGLFVLLAAVGRLLSINAAFSLHNSNQRPSIALRLQQGNPYDCNKDLNQSRRACFRQVVATVVGATLSSSPCAANAIVNVDPDRYGDKELQVGIVNKVRQNVRNAVLETPSLAPLLLEIAIQDALSYSAETQEGGPNGGVVSLILQDKSCPLYPAAVALAEIQVKLRKTTEITMADLVSFGGAEAMESLGGPRMVVQLGKLDGNSNNGDKLYDLQNGPTTIQAFQKAGLTEREVTLLFGALQSMQMVLAASGSSESTTDLTEEEDEPNEMSDPKVDFPSSFGGPSQIYGKRLGKMNDEIFKRELSLQKQKQATGVWTNEVVGEWTTRYAKGGFFKDLPEAYSRLIRVGSTGRWEQ